MSQHIDGKTLGRMFFGVPVIALGVAIGAWAQQPPNDNRPQPLPNDPNSAYPKPNEPMQNQPNYGESKHTGQFDNADEIEDSSA